MITTRWSISNLTGSDRTLVAVGTVSEMSMFLAVRAGAPRKTIRCGSSTFTLGRTDGFGGSAGTPPPAPGVAGRLSAVWVGLSTVGVRRAAAGALGAAGFAGAWVGAGAGPEEAAGLDAWAWAGAGFFASAGCAGAALPLP